MANINILKLEIIKEKGTRYENKNISSSATAYQILKDLLKMDRQSEEVMQLIGLDTKNNIIGLMEVSRGSVNSSIVHPREVFKRALMMNASGIILAHNHPSGDPTPSQEDNEVTKRLKSAGDILGIQVLDHIIIGDECYHSYKEHHKI